jgi:opacity protein-like surface antigen
MTLTTRGLARITGCVLIAIAAAAAEARAEGFLSPLIGYNFGGDASCPEVTGCEDKRLNFGVAVGTLGSVLGFETELGYAKDFFGTAPGLSSSVFTLMGNIMIVPNTGPVRLYALAGLGLIKTNVEFTPESLLSTDESHLGWDVGGGVFVFFGDHVGVRGDLRYFHSFEGFELVGLSLNDTNLDFGRLAGALVLKF